MAHSVYDQLAEILDGYEKEVRETVEKGVEKVAKDTAKNLRQTSPKNSGDYAKNWAVKTDRRNKTTVVYNKAPTYRLTHLLEKGHVIRNQAGTYGRTQAKPHIKPAEEAAVSELVRKIEEDLSK